MSFLPSCSLALSNSYGDGNGQLVDGRMDLRPLNPLVTVIPDQRSPFFAGMVSLSIERLSTLSFPSEYPSEINASIIRFHTPSRSHLLNLLLAVESSPYSSGRSVPRYACLQDVQDRIDRLPVIRSRLALRGARRQERSDVLPLLVRYSPESHRKHYGNNYRKKAV